jgi:H+/Cl- antiporter ClcA
VVSVAWFRWILDATANILIDPTLGFSNLVFAIIVGILIGIASVLLVIIVHRSTKDFFKKSEEDVNEFGETALEPEEKQP